MTQALDSRRKVSGMVMFGLLIGIAGLLAWSGSGRRTEVARS